MTLSPKEHFNLAILPLYTFINYEEITKSFLQICPLPDPQGDPLQNGPEWTHFKLYKSITQSVEPVGRNLSQHTILAETGPMRGSAIADVIYKISCTYNKTTCDDYQLGIATVFNLLGASWAPGKEGVLVDFWPNLNHRIAARPKTSMRLGKFLRRYLTPKYQPYIELICNACKTACGAALDTSNLVFAYGTTRADFSDVYSAPVLTGLSTISGNTGFSPIKSCMQHESTKFNSHPIHPAEAYAHEMGIFSATDSATGHLAARFMVTTDGERYTQPYAAYSVAGNALLAYAKAQGFDTKSMTQGLRGYSLLALEVSDDRYACPYLDCQNKVADNGDGTLVIGGYGDYTPDVSGVIQTCGEDQVWCEDCREPCDESDVEYIDCTEHYVCSYCASNNYTRSDHSGYMIHNNDIVEVYDHHNSSVEWSEEEAADHATYSAYEDCYYTFNACITTECGDVLGIHRREYETDPATGLHYLATDQDWIDIQNQAKGEMLAGAIIKMCQYWNANPTLPFQLQSPKQSAEA